MHHFAFHNGSLCCEQHKLSYLSRHYGTPLYVYSAQTIRDNFRRLKAALAPLNHLVCYAVKANSNLYILNLFAGLGAGFDIVSGGELYRILQAGGYASRCTFAGIGKTREEIDYALREGVYCFIVESEAELETINGIAGKLGRRAPVALRINPDVEVSTHSYITTGKANNKFGIDLSHAEEAYAYAAALPHLSIRGVQTHIGSQILDCRPFVEAIRKLSSLVVQLAERYGIEFFSVGGGMGIVYQEALESGAPQWWKEADPELLTPERYAAALLPLLSSLGVKILFEPGRSLVGNAGILITRVIQAKKQSAKRFVIVDAGMNDLIRPALYETPHQVVPLEHSPHLGSGTADVVGPVCESGDFFLQEATLPDYQPGDYLALMSAGAYGSAMSSRYNSRPLAAEVMVDNSESFLIREREKFSDLILREHVMGISSNISHL
ncbi:MAG: diaminopimelate decarboxylase [Candidatus Xiphinematobacter sp.]|nr:MAG: diaminopimelate decarboxylase [Candidatus Xiphinematobacter sp.]